MAGSEEIERFAACLRALKERSGRSYGVLAGRLHISASTLHRYCNGDAVPADYAPVERLARLSGASAAERTELHRRWLLADAARRGGPAPAPVSAPATVPLRRPAKAPAEVHGAAEREPGERGDEGRPGEQGTELRLVAGAVPAEERRATGRPGNAVSGVPAQGTARISWPHASRALVAGGVAAALLVGLLVLRLTAPDDRPEQPPRGTASVSGAVPEMAGDRRPFASSAPADAAGGGPGAEERGDRAPATGGATAPEGASAPSPTAATGGGTHPGRAGAAAPGGAPLTLTTRSHLWEQGCDHRYLVDKPPSAVPPPPVPQDAAAWASAQGAVHGGTTSLQVTVQGAGADAVVLQALHVRVVDRRTPLAWSAYAMDNGCGGSLTPTAFTVDLDADRPLARPTDGFDAGVGDGRVLPAVRLPFRVTATDPVVLAVNARTEGCDCRWYLELEWAGNGRKGTVRIDDGGAPFRTSATAGRPQYGYWPADGGWKRS
ncbi:helix-turn-helix domain-containing protein [Streptomyces sp. URMC 123]|uniref:helix-turn-helix domain-containing protein n=1 Tax=Streptomyces sp. URMC 123 TaxID=3423403 RepID=UPI003F1AFAA2